MPLSFCRSVIIIIHELGHLMTAKKFGVYCHEFSIGMGPCLWSHKFKETTLSLRAVPFGGYVMMAGEDDGSEELEEMKDIPSNRRLNGISAWKQIVVMAAGAFMNIMLAWALLIGISMVQGTAVNDNDPNAPIPSMKILRHRKPACRKVMKSYH